MKQTFDIQGVRLLFNYMNQLQKHACSHKTKNLKADKNVQIKELKNTFLDNTFVALPISMFVLVMLFQIHQLKSNKVSHYTMVAKIFQN